MILITTRGRRETRKTGERHGGKKSEVYMKNNKDTPSASLNVANQNKKKNKPFADESVFPDLLLSFHSLFLSPTHDRPNASAALSLSLCYFNPPCLLMHTCSVIALHIIIPLPDGFESLEKNFPWRKGITILPSCFSPFPPDFASPFESFNLLLICYPSFVWIFFLSSERRRRKHMLMKRNKKIEISLPIPSLLFSFVLPIFC